VKSYLLRRLWQSLIVLFGVSVVVFLILHLTGDPAGLLLPPDATAEDIAKFRRAMGFDDPVAVQYLRFLKGTASPRWAWCSSACPPPSSWRGRGC
jgi:peptide/nickel transport system permease protein